MERLLPGRLQLIRPQRRRVQRPGQQRLARLRLRLDDVPHRRRIHVLRLVVLLVLVQQQGLAVVPRPQAERPVGQHIGLFQPVPPGGVLEEFPVAGHEGRPRQLNGKPRVRLGQRDGQGVLVYRLDPQLLRRLFPFANGLRVLDPEQLGRQGRPGFRHHRPLHPEHEIRGRHLHRLLPDRGGFPLLRLGQGAPVGFLQPEGVHPPVVGNRPVRRRRHRLAVLVQPGRRWRPGDPAAAAPRSAGSESSCPAACPYGIPPAPAGLRPPAGQPAGICPIFRATAFAPFRTVPMNPFIIPSASLYVQLHFS